MAINPIIPGFAPDPSCIRVGQKYYLVNSTFAYFPGLPIYTSTDLVSWKHVGNAINRLSQHISFSRSHTRVNPPDQWGESMTMTGGLYAPTIRHRDGLFYVVCTNVIHHPSDGGKDERQNFIVTSADPEGDQWSDPVFFDFDGIDTCIFWDGDEREDAKAYIHGSAVPGPMTKIKLFEIDLKTGAKRSAEKVLWEGTGGVYPEGPHLFKKDGWYWLVISEGGCFEDHMITVARSRDLWGPYGAYERNPILTAGATDEYIRNIGHSDLFQDTEGKWWAVALGIRRDPKGRYLMGRETFLTPAEWPEGQWPSISQIKMDLESNGSHTLPGAMPSLTAAPGVDLLYLRDPDLSKHRISHDGRLITLSAGRSDITQGGPEDKVTFVAKRMRALEGHSQVTLKTHLESDAAVSLKAGLTLYKDECRFARIHYDFGTAEIVFEVINQARSISRTQRTSVPETLRGQQIGFRMDSTESEVRFSYVLGTAEGSQWSQAGRLDTLDLTGLDFTGPVVGVYAVGETDAEAVFKNFEVQ
ncbi:uncharacterized protein HMPREF1541_08223 [Cyphellophora europaea CBS 101466]|uniref:Beta-xylosidase C-terminal Concanavalin A-like domain-containing protein n=1 Tax=Cyphellophora europaea (strain CBS 101466) TaxID=1220924 RepID=W2RNF5_CYPE1|nr:uncharacterized protein HMPREF1541_08223 [Cyphellophora europaea CBS 101466]ETN37233.1 hypothetical protein HMPREF1541_08223 [Cyphellophora europaea CBS 101466]